MKSQLLDRRIKMGGGNVRTHLIKGGELLLKHGKNMMRAVVAWRGRREVLHYKIPRSS